MIDAKTIEELQGLLAKATPGPWSTHLVDDTTIMSPAREVATTCDSSQTDREDGYDIEYEQMEADAALIVAMRNALPALLDRLEKAEGELAEAREDVRSLCRFILNEWGPDGALKATTFALEQRQSAKGGDANAAPDRDTNSKSATSPGVTAGASGEAKQVDPDWFWCEIDPDESGDSAYQAMFTYRPRLEPVELCTSYVGPRLWGVMSPPLPDADNDEETAHTFGTREAAQAFCDERNAIFNGAALCPSEGADRG